jgi:transcriptional regulator GlxA family with amidase domain
MLKSDIAAAAPAELGFLLIDGFALMSYASVIEAFRAANVLSGRELYRWVHVSVDGQPVRASNGATILADAAVGDTLPIDSLFVVAGGDPTGFDDRPTLNWLRRLSRSGVTLGGVSGGPFLLAKARLLDGYRATIHWDYAAAFEEAFPTLLLESGLYVIDRSRLTCAGGTAGLELAVELIEREHGHDLGLRVGEWFIRTEPRPPEGRQRINLRDRYGVKNDALIKALARMEATIEEPEPCRILARKAGLSLRQLERLFAAHLKSSMRQVYMRIRLEHADMLLQKTGMSVAEVSAASGFASSSHFSRSYKSMFGRPPSQR